MAETTATAAGPPAGASVKMTRFQLTTVLTVLLSGQLLSALDQSIVGTAMPTMVGQLGRLDNFSLVVTAYLLTSTVATTLYGKLADLYGAKPLYLAAIIVFVAGSALVGASQNMTELVAFRAVQGVGAGGLVIMAFTICASIMPPRQLGRIQGLVGAMYALASLIGPLIGGAFTEYLSWRWCFYLNVPIGAAAVVLVWTQLRLPRTRREHRVDYLGATLLVAGVAALLLVTVWGGATYSWSSAPVLGLLAAAVVLTALFVLRQRSAPEPLVPLHLFRNPDVSLSMVITFIVGVAMFGAFVFLPIYLQVVRGYAPTVAGLSLLPLMIAVMIGSGLSGWLMSAVGRMKTFLVLGTGLMAVGLYLFSLLDAGTPAVVVWGDELIVGVGMGMVVSKLIIAAQNGVSRRDLGTITAQSAFFRIIGASIGTAAFGAVLTARLGYWQDRLVSRDTLAGLPHGTHVLYQDPKALRHLPPSVHDDVVRMFSHSLSTVFLVSVPVMLLAFAVTFFLRDTELRGASDSAPEQAGHGGPRTGSPAGGQIPRSAGTTE
ncbi:MAG: MDR family MFS transporter [Mycobacteriales bacterium]